jgi:hypothetical protein
MNLRPIPKTIEGDVRSYRINVILLSCLCGLVLFCCYPRKSACFLSAVSGLKQDSHASNYPQRYIMMIYDISAFHLLFWAQITRSISLFLFLFGPLDFKEVFG